LYFTINDGKQSVLKQFATTMFISDVSLSANEEREHGFELLKNTENQYKQNQMNGLRMF